MLVCDTSALIAFFDASDAHHSSVSAVIESDAGPFIVSPYVLAELDYLLANRRGQEEELAALAELSAGAWELPCCESIEVNRALGVMKRYRDQRIGLTDGSLVVLAARYRTDRLLTLDRRHFSIIHTLSGNPFALFPAQS